MKLIQVTNHYPLRELIGEYVCLKKDGCKVWLAKQSHRFYALYRAIDPIKDVEENNHTVYMDSFPIEIEGNMEFCYAEDWDISTYCDSFKTNCYGIKGLVQDIDMADLYVAELVPARLRVRHYEKQ